MKFITITALEASLGDYYQQLAGIDQRLGSGQCGPREQADLGRRRRNVIRRICKLERQLGRTRASPLRGGSNAPSA